MIHQQYENPTQKILHCIKRLVCFLGVSRACLTREFLEKQLQKHINILSSRVTIANMSRSVVFLVRVAGIDWLREFVGEKKNVHTAV